MTKPQIRRNFLATLFAIFLIFDFVKGLIVQENQPCNKDRDILLAEDPNGNKQAFLRCVAVGIGSIGFWEKRFCPNDMIFDFVNQQCKIPIATQIVNLFSGASNALTNSDSLLTFAILNSSCSKGEHCIGNTVCDLETMKCLCPIGTVTNLETLSCVETNNFGIVQNSNLPQAKIYPVSPTNGLPSNYFKKNQGTQFNNFGSNNANNADFQQNTNQGSNYGGFNNNFGGSFLPKPVIDVYLPDNSGSKQLSGVFLPEPREIEPISTLVKPGGSCANGEQCEGGSLCTTMKLCLCPGELEDHNGQCVRPLSNSNVNTFNNFVTPSLLPMPTRPPIIVTQPSSPSPIIVTQPSNIQKPRKIESVGIGAYCNEYAECDYDSTCVNSRCACVLPLVEHNGKCVLRLARNQVGPGDLCDNGQICTKGSVCDPIIPVCVCPSGTDLNDGECVQIQHTRISTFESRQTLPPTLIPQSSQRPYPQPISTQTYNNLGTPPTPYTQAPPQSIRTVPSQQIPTIETIPTIPTSPPSSQKPNFMKIQLGGSKQAEVGVRCSLNTDCMIGAYCNGNTQPPTCQCLSTHVNVNGRCEKVIYPGQLGCEHDLQCTTAYAGTTCQNRQCVCPEGSKAIEQTCVSEFSRPGGQCHQKNLQNTTVLVPICLGGSICRNFYCVCPEPLILFQNQCISSKFGTNILKIDILLSKFKNLTFPTMKKNLKIIERSKRSPECYPDQRICADGKGVCIGQLCQCLHNLIYINGKCESEILEIGSFCDSKVSSPRCKQNSTCINNICVCDFHKICNGEIKRSSISQTEFSSKNYAESCIFGDLCLNGTVCVDGYCICPNGYNFDKNFGCEKTIGAFRPINSQCLGNDRCSGGSVCINSICSCIDGSIEAQGKCRQKPGGRCSYGQNCAGGSICQLGMCSCPSGKRLVNHHCIISTSKAGESCQNGQKCINGSSCRFGICICLANYKIVDGKCEKIGGKQILSTKKQIETTTIKTKVYVSTGKLIYAKPGQLCLDDEICQGNSKCKDGYCICKDEEIIIDDKCISNNQEAVNVISTINKSAPGQKCQENSHCTGNSVCLGNICVCPIGTELLQNECQEIIESGSSSARSPGYVGLENEKKMPGSICQLNLHCPYRTECLRGVCRCKKEETVVGGMCRKAIHSVPPGGNCDVKKGLDCVGESQCYYGICVCLFGLINTGNSCENSDFLHNVPPGGDCTEISHCTANSACVNNICRCLDGYVVDINHKCALKSSTVPFYAYPPKMPNAAAVTEKYFVGTLPSSSDKFHQILTANSMSINLVDQETLKSLLLGELERVPNLDEPCRDNCGNGAKCINGKCVCESGFYPYEGKCIVNSGNTKSFQSYASSNLGQNFAQIDTPPLGQPGHPCTSNGVCYNSAVCLQNLCFCKPGFKAANGFCEIAKVPIGAPCFLTEQCNSGTCVNGVCYCPAGVDSRGHSRCPSRDLARPGSDCLNDQVCGFNSICGALSGVCECPNGMETFYQAGECRGATRPRGTICYSSSSCPKNSYCDNGYCLCKTGYMPINGFCLLSTESIVSDENILSSTMASQIIYGKEMGEIVGKGAGNGYNLGNLIGKGVSGIKNEKIDYIPKNQQSMIFVPNRPTESFSNWQTIENQQNLPNIVNSQVPRETPTERNSKFYIVNPNFGVSETEKGKIMQIQNGGWNSKQNGQFQGNVGEIPNNGFYGQQNFGNQQSMNSNFLQNLGQHQTENQLPNFGSKQTNFETIVPNQQMNRFGPVFPFQNSNFNNFQTGNSNNGFAKNSGNVYGSNNFKSQIEIPKQNLVDEVIGSVGPAANNIGTMSEIYSNYENQNINTNPNLASIYSALESAGFNGINSAMSGMNPIYPSSVMPMNPNYPPNMNPFIVAASGARILELSNSNNADSKKIKFSVAMPGEFCGNGATCLGNSVCNQNWCQCPDNMRIEKGICAYQTENFQKMAPKIRRSQNLKNYSKPLESCQNNEICTKNSECKLQKTLGFVCVCIPGTVLFFDSCVPKEKLKTTKLGESCDDSDLCENGSHCLNGKCHCPMNLQEIDGLCIKISKAGESCGSGEHCFNGSICAKNIQICVCPIGKQIRMENCVSDHLKIQKINHRPIKKFLKSLPGQMCDILTDCLDESYCSATGTCECIDENDVIHNHKCVQKNILRYPGEFCDQNTICIEKSFCSNENICECLNKNKPKNKSCGFKIKILKLPKNCAENNDCPKGSGCKAGNCYCGTNVVKSGKKICKKIDECGSGLKCGDEGFCECKIDKIENEEIFVLGENFKNEEIFVEGKSKKKKRDSIENLDFLDLNDQKNPPSFEILKNVDDEIHERNSLSLNPITSHNFYPGRLIFPKSKISMDESLHFEQHHPKSTQIKKQGNVEIGEKSDEKIRSPPGGSCSEKEECSGGSVCREGWCICPDPSMIVTRGLCVQTQSRPTLPPHTITNPSFSTFSGRKAAPGTSCGPLDQCVGGSSCVDSVCLCPAGSQPNQANGRCDRVEPKSVTRTPESTDWLTEELFPSSRQTPLPPRIPTRFPTTSRLTTHLPNYSNIISSSGNEYFSNKYGNRATSTISVPYPSSNYPKQNEIIEENHSTNSKQMDECAKTGLICRGGTICVDLTCQCPPTYILHNDQCVPPITPKKIINKRKGKSSYRGPRYANPAESCSNGEICTGGSICQGKQTCVCPSEKPILRQNICYAMDTTEIKPKIAVPGQECSSEIQCTEQSICYQGICRCQAGFIAISGKCVQVPSTTTSIDTTTKSTTRISSSIVTLSAIPSRQSRLGTGSDCTDDTQCSEHAICVVNKCKCRTGYREADGLCILLEGPQKYGQPCNVQFGKCLQNSKCIDGICKCPLGMMFYFMTNQCEDIRKNFLGNEIRSIDSPPPTISFNSVTVPVPSFVPNYLNIQQPPKIAQMPNIAGNFLKLGQKCRVGFDLCPPNAHCLMKICVCRPEFMYNRFDESCRDIKNPIPEIPVEKSQIFAPRNLNSEGIQQPQIQTTFAPEIPQTPTSIQISQLPIQKVQIQQPIRPIQNPQPFQSLQLPQQPPFQPIQLISARPVLRHTLGQSCQNHDDCLNGAVCQSSICACPATTVEKEGKCLKLAFAQGAAMPGESCENGELCSGGSLCDSGMKKCICAAGHDGTRGVCIRDGIYAALPGESCGHDMMECTGGSICLNNICSCDHDYHIVDGYCRPISAPNSNVEFVPSTGLRFNSNPTRPRQRAQRCDPIKCQLPTCFCSLDGRQIPGNLRRDEIPQFVILTFDDAVNGKTVPDYKYLFSQQRYKNPNGCPIKGTFFISHEWTNYDEVQWIFKNEHELASNSISHNNLQGSSETVWLNEMDGMRRILAKFGNAKEEEIVGMRAPQLAVGGDEQFEMMQRAGFLYDNTISANPGVLNESFWPQTLDYKISWPCSESNCPKSSFPGIWEIPLNQFYGAYMSQIKSYKRSSMLRAAVDLNSTVDELLQMINTNFERAYKTNKAPFVLSLNADFLQLGGRNTGMLAVEKFIQQLENNNDVYFITLKSLVSWMQDPKPLNRIHEFPDIQCPLRMSSLGSQSSSLTCEKPNKCIFPTPSLSSSEHQFLTCNPCPSMYPWLDNPMGILDF